MRPELQFRAGMKVKHPSIVVDLSQGINSPSNNSSRLKPTILAVFITCYSELLLTTPPILHLLN